MSVYPSGTVISNRYLVVQGPHEKSNLAGGMGLVYLSVDRAEARPDTLLGGNGHPVALKTFRPDPAVRDRYLIGEIDSHILGPCH